MVAIQENVTWAIGKEKNPLPVSIYLWPMKERLRGSGSEDENDP